MRSESCLFGSLLTWWAEPEASRLTNGEDLELEGAERVEEDTLEGDVLTGDVENLLERGDATESPTGCSDRSGNGPLVVLGESDLPFTELWPLDLLGWP